MADKKIGVYAGSFDPPTNGHLWMIEQGATLFEELVVAIGTNPNKKGIFSLEERTEMLLEITRKPENNVSVSSFENKFLVHYAKMMGAGYILRGIRDVKDYEYERRMRHINSDIANGSGIITVFLMPPREVAEVSSSAVMEIVGPKGWKEAVRRYVPEAAYDRLVKRFR
jgi:pantetheine-phosphate adenylyltransferase